MGLLIDGVWHEGWYDTSQSGGHFVRTDASFRNWVTKDGGAGPSGVGGFKVEPGRYHLYVSLACPWAHRTLILRKLKGLESIVSSSIVHWLMGAQGWTFEPGDGVTGDRVNGARFLHEIYVRSESKFTGRATVPLLWDTHTGTVVNNESADIMRMFNSAFDDVGAAPGDFYPVALREHIDALNARIYGAINNGVYQAGFATTQQAYEEAVGPVFETLDWLDGHLASRRYLLGERITEADWRLFTTLVRFDMVYFGHFKCNRRRLADYPHLWGYTRDLYQAPGVRETIDFAHIKRHYYQSHLALNPSGIVPVGPDLDFDAPHGRAASYPENRAG